MTRELCILLLLVVASGLPAQQSKIKPCAPAGIERERTEWIARVMGSVDAIRPGMTRKDLSRAFTTEGGLSTRTQRVYVSRRCPYIKVNVKFAPVPSGGPITDEQPEDRIVEVSGAYLQYSVAD